MSPSRLKKIDYDDLKRTYTLIQNEMARRSLEIGKWTQYAHVMEELSLNITSMAEQLGVERKSFRELYFRRDSNPQIKSILHDAESLGLHPASFISGEPIRRSSQSFNYHPDVVFSKFEKGHIDHPAAVHHAIEILTPIFKESGKQPPSYSNLRALIYGKTGKPPGGKMDVLIALSKGLGQPISSFFVPR
jgi:hypothetical protein